MVEVSKQTGVGVRVGRRSKWKVRNGDSLLGVKASDEGYAFLCERALGKREKGTKWQGADEGKEGSQRQSNPLREEGASRLFNSLILKHLASVVASVQLMAGFVSPPASLSHFARVAKKVIVCKSSSSRTPSPLPTASPLR